MSLSPSPTIITSSMLMDISLAMREIAAPLDTPGRVHETNTTPGCTGDVAPTTTASWADISAYTMVAISIGTTNCTRTISLCSVSRVRLTSGTPINAAWSAAISFSVSTV